MRLDNNPNRRRRDADVSGAEGKICTLTELGDWGLELVIKPPGHVCGCYVTVGGLTPMTSGQQRPVRHNFGLLENTD